MPANWSAQTADTNLMTPENLAMTYNYEHFKLKPQVIPKTFKQLEVFQKILLRNMYKIIL